MATLVPTTFSNNLSSSIGSISAGDDVILQDCSVDFTAGLDLSANEIDHFLVAPSCTSSIGAAGSSMLVDLAGTSSYDGQLYYNGRGNRAYVTATSTIALGQIADTGSGTFYGTGGTWAQVEQGNGKSHFNDQSDVQIAHVMGGACTIDVHASDTIDAAIVGRRGSLIARRSMTTATVYGTLTQTERAITIGTLNQHSGTTIHAGGNITTVNGYSGVLDLSQITQDITIGTLNKYADDFTIVKPAGYTVTITTENLTAGATSEK